MDNQITDQAILEKLRPYEQHAQILCLGCGYSGLMGIVDKEVPWYASWAFWGALIAFGSYPIAGFLGSQGIIYFGAAMGVLVMIVRKAAIKTRVHCPSCNQHWFVKL